MLFSYTWLQEYIDGKLPAPKELERLLALHAFEVEEVQQKGKDWIFDIAVLPNRLPDAGNHAGMAREVAAIINKRFSPPKSITLKPKKGTLAPVSVSISSKSLVPRYSAVVLRDVSVTESPRWLKERLAAAGINSINSIVDLTNYIMLELGQPMHAFDYDQIQGQTMQIRESKIGEKLTTLDNESWTLPADAIVIQDEQRLIDLAGIKGGQNSGITKQTKNVLLQAAVFDAEYIYRARKSLGYATPASVLYSSGIDPNGTIPALERALYLLKEVGGQNIEQIIDIYPQKRTEVVIRFSQNYAERILGMQIPMRDIKAIFSRLGLRTAPLKGGFRVTIPTRRLDLRIPEDLIEEIGRLYGYEHIPSTMPEISLAPHEQNLDVLWRDQIRRILASEGLKEVYNYSFIGEADLSNFRYTVEERNNLVVLENPLSEEVKYLRSGMLENLLKNIPGNQTAHSDIRLFEIGKIYYREKKTAKEQWRIAGVLQNNTFYDGKGVVDFLLESLGITEVWYDTFESTTTHETKELWHRKRLAEVKAGTVKIGIVGEIAKPIRETLKVKGTITAFSLNLEAILSLIKWDSSYQPPSKFPASIRDIAILVPAQTKIVDVLNIIEPIGGKLLKDTDVFDIYTDTSLGEERKNLAFHLTYQANDHTLTGQEIDGLHKKIIAALEQNPEWEVRK